jgi:hypothetical protein
MSDITPGTLTERLNQLETILVSQLVQIRDYNETMLGTLERIAAGLGVPSVGSTAYLQNIQQALGAIEGETVRDILAQIRTTIGFDDNRPTLQYLLFSTFFDDSWNYDGISAVNLQQFMQRMIQAQIHTDERVTNIADVDMPEAVNQLTAISERLAGTSFETDINDLLSQMLVKLTAINNRTGTAQNGLSMAELLQVVSECICELNAKTPGTTPSWQEGLLCVPVNAVLLFKIRPEDWVEIDGQWFGCPVAFDHPMPGWSLVTTREAGVATTSLTMLADTSNGELIYDCIVAGSSPSEVVETLTNQAGAQYEANVNVISYSSSRSANNIWNNAAGCQSINLQGVESTYIYHRWYCMVAGQSHVKPTGILYFYVVPA